MTVLSLFDGISCGQIALERVGFKVDKYFASEIDKHAIKVTKHNYPDTIQIGDVTKVSYKDGILFTENGNFEVGKIDLVMGGSPCQGFSFAGKQLNFDDPRSKLFFEFVRLKEEINPTYFLLENVRMKQKYMDVITKYMGVNPVFICSSNFSAQKRKRYYWTNIKGLSELKQSNDGDFLFDVLQNHNDVDKSLYLTESQIERGVKKNAAQTLFTGSKMGNVKFPTSKNEKSKCLNTVRIAGDRTMTHIRDKGGIRLLSRIEYERLQRIPEGYTSTISDNQAFKALGNGWTVDVIAHIFKNMNF